jgi:hypothetical protein
MVRPHPDREEYWRFTGPLRLEKAVRTLEGILTGIVSDGDVTRAELDAVGGWLDEHRYLERRHPFNEIVPALSAALADGRLDTEEIADLTWLCQRLDPERGYFDQITNDMQRLHGMLGGIVADGHVSDEEVDALGKWMADHEHLRTCWPYDELESLLLEVRRDKVIDDRERKLLLAFFGEFSTIRGNRSLGMPLNEVNVPITGLCAVCPEVVVRGRVFCFTGASKKVTRKDFQRIVEEREGTFHPRVTKDIHYLVIGGDGNPCWAYACYGRKVEQAIGLRKAGSQLLLVHEADFWDATA